MTVSVRALALLPPALPVELDAALPLAITPPGTRCAAMGIWRQGARQPSACQGGAVSSSAHRAAAASGVAVSRIGRWTSALKAPTPTPTHQTVS
jgi:hypothetical protein